MNIGRVFVTENCTQFCLSFASPNIKLRSHQLSLPEGTLAMADSSDKPAVAIAGAGDVAKFFVEELLKDGRYRVVVLSRAVRPLPSPLPSQ